LEYHNVFGVTLREHGWVPSPRYLLRRARVLEILDRFPRGNLLEIGCGTGALIEDLRRMGFQCAALEISADALKIARSVHEAHEDVRIYDRPQSDWAGEFDYLLAFEVLEHIEDDSAALRDWRKWLKPNGILALSVPAHMNRWSTDDEWAGHFRRYERESLVGQLESAGFRVEIFENYGVPLATIIDPLRRFFYHGRQRRGIDSIGSRDEQNIGSGVNRPVESGLWGLLNNPIGRLVMLASILAQKPFLRTDIGSNYLVVCRA
jgi:SAM-dependent methyltransferase